MGEVKTIENDRLLIEVNAYGGELVRIYDKKKEREVLWNADPDGWARHAPILFPMVGSCYNKEYKYKGKIYKMKGQHGFARDMVFNFESSDKNEIWYSLKDTEETKEVYPFSFCLKVGHELKENKIIVKWVLENLGTEEMLFSIGAHPAFCMPKGILQKDCGLLFENKELQYILIDQKTGTAIPEKKYNLQTENGFLTIGEHLFDNDALIFENTQVEKVTLTLPEKEKYVTINAKNFPYMGIWSKPNKGFVCLEPWYGRCDNNGFNGELSEKVGVNCIQANEIFEVSYEIEIH